MNKHIYDETTNVSYTLQGHYYLLRFSHLTAGRSGCIHSINPFNLPLYQKEARPRRAHCMKIDYECHCRLQRERIVNLCVHFVSHGV